MEKRGLIGKEFLTALVLISLAVSTGCLPEKGVTYKSIKLDAPFDMPVIREPVFSERNFDIRDYGAKSSADYESNGRAITAAIEACNKNGGGKVIVPAGKWQCGPIRLKSNVNLHLAEGAEIHFTDRFEAYLPVVLTRIEGIELYNYSPLVYAYKQENIAVTGKGKLFGHGQRWWPWKKTQEPDILLSREMGYKGTPVKERIFGREKGLRPSLLQPFDCKNVLIEDVTVHNSPMWCVHPVYCENMVVRGVRVFSEEDSPNTDGIDIDSCRNVLIEDCEFSNGDDCITLKSGRNQDGWRVAKPCENIYVRNCLIKRGHGGLVIGSEMSGDVRNVYLHDCVFNGTDRGIRIKSLKGRGGVVENIWVKNVDMGKIRKDAIILNMFYSSRVSPFSEELPTFRNMYFDNITCQDADEAVSLLGLEERAVSNIHISNIKMQAEEGVKISNAENIFIKNAVIIPEENPVYEIINSRDITLLGCDLMTIEKPIVKIRGAENSGINLQNCNFSGAPDEVFQFRDGADLSSVIVSND